MRVPILFLLFSCSSALVTLDVLLSQQPSLSVFFRTLAAQSGDLLALLKGSGVSAEKFTLFAPTNDAISAYGGFFPSFQDLPRFLEQLKYHVAPGKWEARAWDQVAPSLSVNWAIRLDSRQNSVPTVSMLSLTSVGGILAVNQVLTEGPALEGANGLIYIVDRVLELPGSVSVTAGRIEGTVFQSEATRAGVGVSLDSAVGVTVFVPINAAFPPNKNYGDRTVIDVIRSHVVMQVVYANELSSELKNILGDRMVVRRKDNTSRELFVGNCRVLEPNIITRTGVIHIVDSLFVPPSKFIISPTPLPPSPLPRPAPTPLPATQSTTTIFVVPRETPTPKPSGGKTRTPVNSKAPTTTTSGGTATTEAELLSPGALKAIVAQPRTQICVATCMGSIECVSRECTPTEWAAWDDAYRSCVSQCVQDTLKALAPSASPQPTPASPSKAPTPLPTSRPTPAPTTCLRLCIGDADCLARPCSEEDWEYYADAYAICKDGCGLEDAVPIPLADLPAQIQIPTPRQARLVENCMGGIDCRVCTPEEHAVWTEIYATCWEINVGLPIPPSPLDMGLNPFTLSPLAPRIPRRPPTSRPTRVGATSSPTTYCVDACVTQSSNTRGACLNCPAEDLAEFRDTTQRLCAFVCKYVS